MQTQIIRPFDQIEFEEAVKSGMEVSLDGPMSIIDIHCMIVDAFSEYDEIPLESGPVPLEWKTGFVFGVIRGLFQYQLVKENGDLDKTISNRH